MRRLLYARRKNPSTHWIGGWVKFRADLEIEKKKVFALAGNRTLILWSSNL
jgi:hypothetical protein